VGSIALFARAKGQPKIVKGYGEIYFVTYDAKGNLFGDGMDARSAFALFELPAGSKKFVPLKVHGAVVEFPATFSIRTMSSISSIKGSRLITRPASKEVPPRSSARPS
jgi:hypothetical protein